MRIYRPWRDLLALAAGARRLRRGERAEAAGRLPEARDILLELLSRLGPEASTRLLAPAHLSLRLTSLVALSRVAARLEDHALARSAIQEGLGLWAAARLTRPRARELQAFAEWEAWARSYLIRP